MRVRSLRRQFPTFFRLLPKIALILVTVESLCLIAIASAQGATSVNYLTAEPVTGFDATRVYAGRTVAGRASELGFKHSGELATLQVDIGDAVLAGEPIASLNTRSQEARLAEARADVKLAAANLLALEAETQLARQTEARFRSLRDKGHASDQVYDEQRLALRAKEAQLGVARANLTRAQANEQSAAIVLEEAHITAPFDGIVQARYFDEGAQTRPGSPIIRLVEISNKEAHVGVPETMASQLQPGTVYTLRWNGQRLTARLKALLPEIDPASRTVSAVLNLTDPRVPLGAVIELEVTHQVASSGYWVPMTALTESDRGLWGVFVVGDEARLERRLVEIVHVESDRAFVRGTLNQGDQVVSTGVQRLVPGQQVAAARMPVAGD